MKLYTRSQIVKIVVAACILTAGLTTLILKSVDSKKHENEIVTTEIQNQQKIDEELILETNSAVVKTVANNNSYTQDELQNINVYELCNEAVVNINTKVVAYDWFLDPYVQDGGSGSGSIIDKRGYILTNVHVIQDASKIYVSLSDGSQYEAEVVGQDLDSDLAVLKFNPPQGMELKTISFGDSTGLKVGQKVIAIGNPFGMERTMTTGIVSAIGRPIQNSNKRIIRNMIQTDTAINPGNSGGPLLNTSGQMIGINTMIMSNSGSSSGVGFAVPSETAVRVVADLIKYGKVQRGVIDATIIQLNSRIAQYAKLDISSGILVSQVKEGKDASIVDCRTLNV